MNFKNDGLTVGELSIAITTLIIIGFIWTSLAKDNKNQEVSMRLSNISETIYDK